MFDGRLDFMRRKTIVGSQEARNYTRLKYLCTYLIRDLNTSVTAVKITSQSIVLSDCGLAGIVNLCEFLAFECDYRFPFPIGSIWHSTKAFKFQTLNVQTKGITLPSVVYKKLFGVLH